MLSYLWLQDGQVRLILIRSKRSPNRLRLPAEASAKAGTRFGAEQGLPQKDEDILMIAKWPTV